MYSQIKIVWSVRQNGNQVKLGGLGLMGTWAAIPSYLSLISSISNPISWNMKLIYLILGWGTKGGKELWSQRIWVGIWAQLLLCAPGWESCFVERSWDNSREHLSMGPKGDAETVWCKPCNCSVVIGPYRLGSHVMEKWLWSQAALVTSRELVRAVIGRGL